MLGLGRRVGLAGDDEGREAVAQRPVGRVPAAHVGDQFADVAQRLNALMVNNENSYAGNGKITGVQIAAKTGTAEHGDDPKNLAPHVWYVAFAPAEAPQVAVAVLVEDGGDPNNLAATGGLVAAPIGRAVIAAALGKASR